jgi:hypothetical protein
MGIGDKFDELKQTAEEMIRQHPDKVEQGIDKAEHLADERTGGKYTEQIGKGAEQLKRRLGEQPPSR